MRKLYGPTVDAIRAYHREKRKLYQEIAHRRLVAKARIHRERLCAVRGKELK